VKDRIRKFAFELGFDLCGFSSAKEPSGAEFFRHWIRNGYHAEMDWMKRTLEKRINPALVLENAKTIISVGVSYFVNDRNSLIDEKEKGRFWGKIARYSQFIDYHIVIKEKLELLAGFIMQNYPGEKTLCYVDTGPVLEREFAQSSGIGFIGKHTNLISRSFGNWVLLGEIITTVAIEPDQPETNHCGKCRRCIEVCPTGAITAPFTLDSSKCISYLTIENKGVIPVDLRKKIGNHLFGCDDCLEVCPWNRFAGEGRLMTESLRKLHREIDIATIFDLDNSSFRKMFGGTPIQRTGLRRLLRNACVVLGNTGDKAAIKLLEKVLQRNDPLINEHALWAINEIRARQPAYP
jgi:epoxyqueuosine reductase